MTKHRNIILFPPHSSWGEGTQGVLHWAGSVGGQSGLRLLCPTQLHGNDIRVGGLQSVPHYCGDYCGPHTIGGHICIHHVGGAGGTQTTAAHLRRWLLSQSAVNGYAYLSQDIRLRYKFLWLGASCGILIHALHCFVGPVDVALLGHIRNTASEDTQ